MTSDRIEKEERLETPESEEQDENQGAWKPILLGFLAFIAVVLTGLIVFFLYPRPAPPVVAPPTPIAAEGLSIAVDPKALNSNFKVMGRVEMIIPPMPPSMASVSLFYGFDIQGDPNVTARFTIPLQGQVGQNDLLDAYSYTNDGKWQWVGPAAISSDGKSLEVDARSIPANLIAVRLTKYPVQVSGSVTTQSKISSKAAEAVSVLNVRGYSVKSDGTLSGFMERPAGKYLVIPTISAADFNTILRSPDSRDRHLAALLELVQGNAYDGIDLDYPDISASVRDDFSKFVANLADALHRDGKTLSIRLPLPAESKSGLDTAGYDWRELGKAADVVKIAAEKDQSIYDKRMSDALTLAVSQIDRRKIQLSVSTLSHDKGKTTIKDITTGEALRILSQIAIENSVSSPSGQIVTLIAPALLTSKGATGPFWNDQTNTVSFVYVAREGTEVVWIENSFSIARKVQMVTSLGLGGIALDDVTDDVGDGVWTVISDLKSKGSVSATRPNESSLKWSWETKSGAVAEQEKGRAKWTVKDEGPKQQVTLVVSDGESRYASTLVTSLAALKAPSPRPTPGGTAYHFDSSALFADDIRLRVGWPF